MNQNFISAIRINRRRLLTAAALLPFSGEAAGAEKTAMRGDGLLDLGVVDGGAAATGDLLRLPDGRDVRLACVEAAAPPADAEPGRRRPLAENARDALAAFTAGRLLRLWGQSAEPDRRGRLVAHVQRTADGLWAQETLLADGLARVRPAPGDDARARALLAIENAARNAKKGVWATRVYAVRQAADVAALARDYGLLTVAEGRPTAAAVRNGKTYLDFGEDWRRDFTAVVAGPAARALKREGVDPAALTGRALRVRGWPERRFGPQMEIVVAAQLEILD